MTLTFTITNPDTTVVNPRALTYTITDTRFRYSEATFRVSNIYDIRPNAIVNIADVPNGTVPFMGFVESVLPSSPGTSLVSCASFSKLLIERGLWSQTWAADVNLDDILTSDPPSASTNHIKGLLFDVNSLVQKGLLVYFDGYPTYTFVVSGLGTDYHDVLAADAVMKGETVLTRTPDVQPNTLQVDHWTQTRWQVWIRLSASTDPFTYPIYIKNFKDTHIRLIKANIEYNENPITTSWDNNAYGTLRDVLRTNEIDWRFINALDGNTYLEYRYGGVGDGSPSWEDDEPVLVLVENSNLLNYEINRYGQPNLLYAIHSEGVGCWGVYARGLIRERILSELTYNAEQAWRAMTWESDHNLVAWSIRTKSVEDTSINCGDWYKVILEDSTVHEVRVHSKTLQDGLMWLVGVKDYNGWT